MAKKDENPEVQAEEQAETKTKVLVANKTVHWAEKKDSPVMVFEGGKEVKGLPKEVADKMVKANLMRMDYVD